MLTVQHLNITHERDLRPLIRDLSFTLAGNERLAVIGEEGNGKSALLRAIVCPEELKDWASVSGRVTYPGERPGYLAQAAPGGWDCMPVWALCQADPWFLKTDIKELAGYCRTLGMDTDLCYSDTPFGLLSGGEKVRLRLLLMLCSRPTLLLLDEPGNDLDLSAILCLERFLLTVGLPVLFVSHDEKLLSAAATQVLHLESVHGRMEPRWTWARMPYDAYVADRRARFDRQEALWQADRRERQLQEEKLRRIENAVAHAQAGISRQDPHGGRLLKKKMKAVKSLENRYEREKEAAVARPAEESAMRVMFTDIKPIPLGKRVLELELPALTAGERTLASPVELMLRGPEKVLITGENGSGKTTLLRLILEELGKDRSLCAAYMPQRYEDALDPSLSPEEYLNTDGTKETLTQIRTLLVAKKFARDELSRPIGALSGGQKAKVLLAGMLLRRPDVLLLDEPTRNLSPLSAPVMRDMIRDFPGAVICVTHDRLLIDGWPGRVLRLTERGLLP